MAIAPKTTDSRESVCAKAVNQSKCKTCASRDDLLKQKQKRLRKVKFTRVHIPRNRGTKQRPSRQV